MRLGNLEFTRTPDGHVQVERYAKKQISRQVMMRHPDPEKAALGAMVMDHENFETETTQGSQVISKGDFISLLMEFTGKDKRECTLFYGE